MHDIFFINNSFFPTLMVYDFATYRASVTTPFDCYANSHVHIVEVGKFSQSTIFYIF